MTKNYPLIVFDGNTKKFIENQSDWQAFSENFRIIHAAGGIVLNENREILMIYRLENWDLPKGKVEDGENFTEAAIREVSEETGVDKLTVIDSMSNTYHTYNLKGEAILKVTHWFLMRTEKTNLIPQTEEDIVSAEWIDYEKVATLLSNSYPSLKDLWEKSKSYINE